MCGKTGGGIAKGLYGLFMFGSWVIAIAFKYGDSIDIFSFDDCDGDEGCLGNQSVYRVSFTLMLFFIQVGLFSLCFPDYHYGYWFTKLAIYVGLLICTFLMPNDVFDVYVEIARVVSFIFLMLQILILIDLAYDIHEFLLEFTNREDQSICNCCPVGTCAKIGYLALCALLGGIAFTGIGVLFGYLGDCDLNNFFTAFTLILGLIGICISILERVGKGLMPPLVVFCYAVYLCWEAIYSNPSVDCNPNAGEHNNVGLVIVGLAISGLSLAYTSWSAARSGINLFRVTSSADSAPAPTPAPAPQADESGDKKSGDAAAGGAAEEAKAPGRHWFFHFVMAMGAIYMSMLLTNWGSNKYKDDGANKSTTVSTESMWIKITSQWLTFILYYWTMTAPLCFPDRDFSDNHNSFK